MPSSPILPPAGTLRRRLLAAAGATVAGSALPVLPALAQSGAPVVPAGYPDDYEQTIARGQREGAVTVYATTDLDIVRPLILAFEARYPASRSTTRT